MRVAVNDELRETAAENITALVDELGLAPGSILVEHNGTALRPSEWSERTVCAGDRVEIIRIVAGG